MPSVTIPIEHSAGSLARAIMQEKKKTNYKEKVKLFLIADYMIFYIENPKDYIKSVNTKSKWGKVAEYEMNTRKSAVFLYTNSEIHEKQSHSIKEHQNQ